MLPLTEVSTTGALFATRRVGRRMISARSAPAFLRMLHATSWCASQRSPLRERLPGLESTVRTCRLKCTPVRNIRLRCPKFEDAVRVNGTFSASIIALNPCKLTPAARYRQCQSQKKVTGAVKKAQLCLPRDRMPLQGVWVDFQDGNRLHSR